MHMIRKILAILLLTSIVVTLTGCATGSNGHGVLPQGGATMSDIYNHQNLYSGQDDTSIIHIRSQLNNTREKVNENILSLEKSSNSLQTSMVSESSNVPHMLPNPLIQIYVSQHFDHDDQDYVPAHLAYTKLYEKEHFALPGEPRQLGA